MSKRKKFTAPFLEIVMRADGHNLVTIHRQDPAVVTARTFEADLIVSPVARRLACAIAFLETAIALVGDQDYPTVERIQEAVARLVIMDTPWGQMLDQDYPPNN